MLEVRSIVVGNEAIKAQRDTINSQNATTIYIPVGPMGVPIAGNLNLAGHEAVPKVTVPAK